MKYRIAALTVVASLALGACAKQSDAGNVTTTDTSANVDAASGDLNTVLDNGADLGGNALDATGGNTSNAL